MAGICRKRPKTEVGKILNTNKMKKIKFIYFLHAENLNVRSGTSSFNIYPRNPMPTGLLINVFKFSDNSISTINTRKI
jgi:hypothetical protein